MEDIVHFNLNHINNVKFISVHSFIYSIIHNLISNSIKYKSPDKELIIGLSLNYNNGIHTIVFQDNGIGINKNNISKVFRPYTRFNTKVKGSGIGLYLVQSQVEMMGGKIFVDSVENEGTMFTIQFFNNQ